MKTRNIIIFLLVFFIPLNNIHSIEITKCELEAFLRGEYNRASNYDGDLSAIASLELNNLFNFSLGFSMGMIADSTHIKTHTSAAIAPFSRIPLDFRVMYILNSIPDYDNNTHTILPLVSFNASRAGISLGPALRFTSFFGANAQFESILSFSVYFNFINSNNLRIGISIGNFNDFQVKNFGAYSMTINTLASLDSNWQIINELEFSQSGGDGFSTTFFGFGYKGGVKYTW